MLVAVPAFRPFRGLRYATTDGRLDDVVAPPYDVVDAAGRAALLGRSPHNAIEVELPAGGDDRYSRAADTFRAWEADGVLVRDEVPTLSVVRMTYDGEDGARRSTVGVVGALELSRPGEGGILPHERTTPKDKADRLELLRATRTNVSPVWGLSPAGGLSALLDTDGPPTGAAVDEDGVVHEVWRIDDPARIGAIAEAIAAHPVVIADGHHRYEVALAYRDEAGDEGAGSVLTYVVELAEEQLTVRAIHRLVTGLPAGFDLVAALDPYFEVGPPEELDATVLSRMEAAAALGLVTDDGAVRMLRPRPSTVQTAGQDLDSARLDVALGGFPPHDLRFQHGWDLVTDAVADGTADIGFLLRPATVAQIAETGRGGDRMPPKTTFFAPKPRTGLVFRPLDDTP